MAELEPRERALGFWTGKAIGVSYGRPVENLGRAAIQAKTDWNSDAVLPLEEGDDDLTMAVATLVALERHGPEITREQAAAAYLDVLPNDWWWQFHKNLKAGQPPHLSGRETESGGQNVGGMIVSDLIGFVQAGDLKRAVTVAEDVSSLICHNAGIDGGAAGAILATSAFRKGGVPKSFGALKKLSTSEVPALVKDIEKLRLRQVDEEEFWASLDAFYPWVRLAAPLHFDEDTICCHATPNLALVLGALAWGEFEFEASVKLCASFGLDTDTNCGLIGAALGADGGAESIRSDWRRAIGDHIVTPIEGNERPSLDELADRTVALLG